MSQHDCGCVSSFYLVAMPGKDKNGSFWSDKWYYCDANAVGGDYCPEFDLQEGNKWAFQTTPHTCNAPSSVGFYDWCDGGGQCVMNIADQLQWNGYGPGSQYTINTEEQFHVKVEFLTDSNGQMNGFSTTFT